MMEERLLARYCRQGRQDAGRELYERYVGRLLAVCLRYLGNMTEAEDAVHNVFLKAFDSIGRFVYTGEGSLGRWLGKIAVNESLQLLRQKKRLVSGLDCGPEPPDDVGDDPPDDCEVVKIPPEELMRMITELPDRHRTVFNLHCLDGYSHREVARMLGIKENTSASRYKTARALLAEEVKKYLASNGKE